ncbi:hypothetical protein ACIQUS_07810 [Pseudomonas sp. NPDC090755]|uniref:hypothetical protein n=1 Tax=Pseudomonas sp. NPDC090755 TaxID=3364481 RepID=UPI00383B5E32
MTDISNLVVSAFFIVDGEPHNPRDVMGIEMLSSFAIGDNVQFTTTANKYLSFRVSQRYVFESPNQGKWTIGIIGYTSKDKERLLKLMTAHSRRGKQKH